MPKKLVGSKKTFLILGYTVCMILLLLYVNMFPVWKFFSTRWGAEVFILMPVGVSVCTIIVIVGLSCLLQKNTRVSVRKLPIIIGILLCLLALLIPDPQFPVKRIHVAEYVLLSLMVRWTMSLRLKGLELLIFSAFFVSLLGVHDELLQGLHPARTYGLRDMAVNTLSGFGGALIWHGLHFFTSKSLPSSPKDFSKDRLSILYVGWLLICVLAFILPVVLYRGGAIPFWPAMPLIGAMVLFYLNADQCMASWKHGVGALSVASFALIIYPIVTHGEALVFY